MKYLKKRSTRKKTCHRYKKSCRKSCRKPCRRCKKLSRKKLSRRLRGG